MPGYHWVPASLQGRLLDREAKRDRMRLEREVTELAAALDSVREASAELDATYRCFVDLPEADPVMAASPELARFLLAWCRCRRPRRIADLGSGFSSWLFRWWAAAEPEEVTVVSVDDDPAWLERSRAFVASRGLDASGFVEWPAFLGGGERFDLVLWDYGDIRIRAERLPEVLARVDGGGALVCDDVHKHRVWKAARSCAGAPGLESYSLRAYTLDRWGRYAWLARRLKTAKSGREPRSA